MSEPFLRTLRRGLMGTAGPTAVLVVFVGPIVLLILGSLRPAGTPPPPGIDLIPPDADLSNFRALLAMPSIRRQVVNSLMVAMASVPLGTLVASWAGFAIARLPGRAARSLIAVTLVAATVPVTSLFVGRLLLFRYADLTDTPVPLIAPALLGVSPLLVLLFAWSYHTIPGATYDLAREAGLGPLGVWWHVAMPLRAGVAALAASLAFIVSWGNLLDPLLYVYDERWFTLPVGLTALAELPPTDHGMMLAASGLAVLPVLAGVAFAQRIVVRRGWW